MPGRNFCPLYSEAFGNRPGGIPSRRLLTCIMKLKNDPYFPVVALAIIAALFLSLLNPSTASAGATAHQPHEVPANTITASAAAITHAE